MANKDRSNHEPPQKPGGEGWLYSCISKFPDQSAFSTESMHGLCGEGTLIRKLRDAAVKPALTTRLLGWFVVAAVLIRHGAKSGERGTLTAVRKRRTWQKEVGWAPEAG